MSVQTSYATDHGAAYPGLVGDMNNADIISRAAGGSIPVGRVVVTSGTLETALLPVSAGLIPLGVAARSLDIPADASQELVYEAGNEVAILEKGAIWIEAADAVAVNGAVFFIVSGADAGKVSAIDDATTDPLPNAVFLTAGADGDLVKIKIPAAIRA